MVDRPAKRKALPVPCDLEEAIEFLAFVKHWTIKTCNRNGKRHGYECTLWTSGRRVSATSTKSPFAAVQAAFAKLNVFKLRIAK